MNTCIKIDKKKILITGADGQLGRALFSVLDKNVYDIILTGIKEQIDSSLGKIEKLDITEKEEVNRMLEEQKPDFILNCASLTAVDFCESHSEEAFLVNALGPEYLAKSANEIGSCMVQISTDYVFDGMASSPYKEEAAVNPQSVYGKSKAQGEVAVKESCNRYFLLRTAWLYGEGKNFVRTMLEKAKKGGEIRVVNDQYGNPTSAKVLAQLIAGVIKTDQYGIYHAVCSGKASWYDLAKETFQISGLEVPVVPIKTGEYPVVAKRPSYSCLDNQKIKKLGLEVPDWRNALEDYIRNGEFGYILRD